MIPYIATIVVLLIITRRKKKEYQAPAALGASYFREER
jgi:simple sugar transport system permease protein